MLMVESVKIFYFILKQKHCTWFFFGSICKSRLQTRSCPDAILLYCQVMFVHGHPGRTEEVIIVGHKRFFHGTIFTWRIRTRPNMCPKSYARSRTLAQSPDLYWSENLCGQALLWGEAYFTTLAILICREGSFRITLQTNCKHVCVPTASNAWYIVKGLKLFDKKIVISVIDALYTLSFPHPTTEISWLMLACLFRCSKMPPVYLEHLLDNFFKYSSNALKCLLWETVCKILARRLTHQTLQWRRPRIQWVLASRSPSSCRPPRSRSRTPQQNTWQHLH